MNEDVHARYLNAKESRPYFASNPTTDVIRKWMRIGVKDRRKPRSNDRIKLKSLHEGGYVVTTIAWIREFQIECQKNVKGGS